MLKFLSGYGESLIWFVFNLKQGSYETDSTLLQSCSAFITA